MGRFVVIAVVLLVTLALSSSGVRATGRALAPATTALRKLHQTTSSSNASIAAGSLLPKRLAQCAWDTSFPPHCALSFATIFQVGAKTVNWTNYAARANAFVVAAGLHCNTLAQGECSWPCVWDNQATCMLADQPRLTVYDCPNSPARSFYTCPQAPRLTKAWCLSTPGCSYVPQPPEASLAGLRACESTLYVNMTPAQRLDFGGAMYYVRMPREQIGCCKGSTYRYTRNTLCRGGELSEANCTAITGCAWGVDGSCRPSAAQQVKMLFNTYPRDPLNALLQAMARRCDAITNVTACNSYRPVSIDAKKVMSYLTQDLDRINTPIAESKCIVPSASSSALGA